MQETAIHNHQTTRADEADFQGTGAPLSPGSRIILAESDDLSRKRMQRILEDQGFEVISVTDGFELICRIPEWRPDILMAAADLPRLSGPQVCALLHQCPDYRHLPVFILRHAEAQNQNSAFEVENCGSEGVLSSPFSTDELSTLLESRTVV